MVMLVESDATLNGVLDTPVAARCDLSFALLSLGSL